MPVHVLAQRLIEEYLALAGHADDATGPVFRPDTRSVTRSEITEFSAAQN